MFFAVMDHIRVVLSRSIIAHAETWSMPPTFSLTKTKGQKNVERSVLKMSKTCLQIVENKTCKIVESETLPKLPETCRKLSKTCLDTVDKMSENCLKNVLKLSIKFSKTVEKYQKLSKKIWNWLKHNRIVENMHENCLKISKSLIFHGENV
jgi:ubiquinone/menaquinone biosynthesis C-methylase UbiE